MRLLCTNDIFLPVTDLDRSLDWFKRIFGVRLEWRQEERMKIKRDGMTFAQTPDVNPLVHMPYVIGVTDAVGLYYKLQEKGLELTEIRDGSDTKSFSFIDVEGNAIGIEQNE